MVESLAELRALTDDDVITKYNDAAKTASQSLNYYLTELNRRYQERQANTMLEYTGAMLRSTNTILGYTSWIKAMTVVITLTTIVNVVLTAVLMLAS